jgi:outer membrane protein assembly factor BamB
MRRRAFAYRVLAAIVVLVTVGAPAHATRTSGTVDWPEYGFDAANTGHNPFETVLDATNVDSLRRIWFGRLIGVNEPSGAAARVGGVLYFCAGDKLYALGSTSGVGLWKVVLPGGDGCRDPAVHDGRVFVNVGLSSVYAYDASTGAELWSRDVGGAGSPSIPAVADGMVYVTMWDGFYALDETTGEVRWSNDIFTHGSPAIGGGRVFIDNLDEKLYAFDALTGALHWSHPIGGTTSGSAIYANGVVYAPGAQRDRITALDASTGSALWTRRVCEPGTPALADGVLFVPLGNIFAECGREAIIALDAGTGAALWRMDLLGSLVPSPPAVANGVVYIRSSERLTIIDASSGLLLNQIDLGSGFAPPAPAPIVVNGMVFAAGRAGGEIGIFALGL